MATIRNASGQFSRKQTIPTEQQLAQDLEEQTQSLWARIGEFFGPYTPARTFAIFIARITLYALGAVTAMYAVSALSTAMLIGGWPLFLIMVFEIIGIICAIVASWQASDAIVNYVVAGNVTRDIKRARNWLSARLDSTSSYVKAKVARTVH